MNFFEIWIEFLLAEISSDTDLEIWQNETDKKFFNSELALEQILKYFIDNNLFFYV